MARYRRKKGQRIGPWKLLSTLGSGGNAEVWRATGNDGTSAALKILYNTKLHDEPYRRFKAEVKVVQNLGDQSGILPLINYNVPDNPSQQYPAWLAMPIATPILKALGSEPRLETVVDAVATMADTLTSLALRRVFHRDIKPGNLYRYGENWVIGDFGLASYPDKEALTTSGKKLGPLYFLADEMISNPNEADPALADVYALAKTLWVLATGQNFPPQGELRTDVRGLTISGNVAHSRAYLLDNLIQSATRHDPKQRPSMGEVANELRAWLAPPVRTSIPESLTNVAARITAVIEPAGRSKKIKEQARAALNVQGQRVLERLEEKLHPLAVQLATLVPNVELKSSTIPIGACKPREDRSAVIRVGRCVVASGPDILVNMWCGMGIELPSDEGKLYLAAAHVLRPPISEHKVKLKQPFLAPLHVVRIGSFEHRVIWSDHRWVPVNSAQEEQAIDFLFNELVRHLPYALEWFAAALEERYSYSNNK